MATNRYGRIYHSDHHYNTLRFPSADARREFAEKFEQHHAKYDHDGEVPRFEDTTAAEANKGRIHDADSVTIDGYAAHEIYEYHNRDDDRYVHYRPPTTITPIVIVIQRNGEFIDASTLQRHELSADFGDMSEENFENLMHGIEKNGIVDPIIRIHEGQILDGWHRYSACKELNHLRKLRFKIWQEDTEGDPLDFVCSRNLDRRHYTPAQRAQVAVRIYQRHGHGGDRTSKTPNGVLKTIKELAEIAGVGTTTINRAVQVENAGESKAVIAGDKTAGQVIEEMTVKELWEQINPTISTWKKDREGVGHASKSMFVKATLRWEGLPADTKTDVKVLKILLNLLTTTETNILEELIRKQLDGKSLWEDPEALAEKRKLALDAEHRMFAALDAVVPDWDTDDFIAAACDKHDWGVTEFPDLDYTEIPTIWEGRYDLLRREIEEPAAWIQEMLDKMAEPTESEQQETEQPKQTAEEREADTDLKRKKQAVKSIWDKRIEAAQDYTGDADSDLNLNLTLPELEKGFAKYEEHAYCADAFQSAIRRTSETSFNICLEKTLSSDVSLEDLGAEYKALSTYALDLLQWQKQEWIQQLIDKKRKKADAKAKASPEEKLALWEAFHKRLPKWKAKYAESGYKENDLIQAATDTELFDALRSYRHSDRTGNVTAEEIQDLTDLMKRQSYPYARHVRNLLRDKQKSEGETPDAEETDAETDLEKALESLMEAVAEFDQCFLHDADFHSDDYSKLCDLAAVAFNYDRDMLYQILFDEDCPEDFGVAELKKWEKIVRRLLEDVKADADWLQPLQAQVSAKERLVTEVEEDTSLEDLNLPALKSFLDSLMYHVKPVEHPITRDNFSVAVFDALVADNGNLTEREQLSILLDCAQSIVTEYESLDNEVLCPDDEADRQAMNSDIVK